MAAKITWDVSTSIGTITEAPNGDGVLILNVAVDIWSGAVLDWQNLGPTYRQRDFPLSYEGGTIDPITGAQTGPLFRLRAPWKLQTYDSTHELRLVGVLRTDDGSRYWLPPPTPGNSVAIIPEIPEDVVSFIPPSISDIELVARRESQNAVWGARGPWPDPT